MSWPCPRDLCPTCCGLRPDTLPDSAAQPLARWRTSFPGPIYLFDFAYSGEQGCGLCGLVPRCIREKSPDAIVHNWKYDLPIYKGYLDVRLHYYKGLAPEQERLYRIAANVAQLYQPFGLVPPPALATHFASDDCMRKISKWMMACNRNHPHSERKRSLDAPLPHRVLDLARGHLHVSAPGETGRYVALSHTWGKKPIITKTTKNIAQMHSRIDIAALLGRSATW